MKKLFLILLILAGLAADASAQLIRQEQIEDVFAVRDEDEVISGSWQFAAKLFFDADSPAQITATQNDYNPGNKIVSRLSSDATRSITGIAGGATYQVRVLVNIGSFDITLAHEGASSAANRIATVTGSDLTLGPAKLALLVYDATSTRWRAAVLGAAGGGVGTPGGSDTQCQFNDGGSFGGDAGCTYNKTTDILTVLGGIVAGDVSTNSVVFDTSGVSGSRTIVVPNESGTLILDSSTASFTNKNLDCEATGNTCTIPVYWDYDTAGCIGGVASHVWNTGVISAPTVLCATGSNRVIGYVQFPDSDGDIGLQISKDLPPGWTGAIDARVKWWSTATTGDAVFQIATSCVATGDADDGAFNTASTVASTAQGTASRMNVASLTDIDTTGCAAGETIRLKFFRNRTHASDTIAAVVNVEKVIFTARMGH